jgi:hypothetical protein
MEKRLHPNACRSKFFPSRASRRLIIQAKIEAFGLAEISSLGKPLLECLEKRISKARLDRRWSCERSDAQVLNATEFIEMEIEDQGDNNLQVEFAVGCVGDKFATLFLNACAERLLSATRDVAPLPFDFSVCG